MPRWVCGVEPPAGQSLPHPVQSSSSPAQEGRVQRIFDSGPKAALGPRVKGLITGVGRTGGGLRGFLDIKQLLQNF